MYSSKMSTFIFSASFLLLLGQHLQQTNLGVNTNIIGYVIIKLYKLKCSMT